MRRRFTLVELMIVVAIIAVLAMIAVPIVADYQRRAKRSEVPINANAIAMAVTAHYDEGFPGAVGGVVAGVHPRAWDVLDSNAVPWSPAPTEWAALGFQPDGNVRCTYYASIVDAAAIGGQVASWGTGTCDIDNDNLAYVYAAYHGMDGFTQAPTIYCKPFPTGGYTGPATDTCY